jgi:ATP-dependent Clp protease adaptor protein ClpS
MDEPFESADQDSSVSTTVVPDKRRKQNTRRQPKYHVLLWDDDHHSYEYVMHMMRTLFGHPVEKSYEIATEVDNSGRAICLTTTMEHAELKRDQIHSYGKDDLIAQCKGSMYSTIEADVR